MVAQLVALRPGPTRWFNHDALGSSRALSNASGAVVGTFTYGPYGTLTASTGTAVISHDFDRASRKVKPSSMAEPALRTPKPHPLTY
jgi:hypothetical protein